MKNYKLILISFILLFFMMASVSAGDFNETSDNLASNANDNEDICSSGEINEKYVDVNGDDSKDGSQSNPYASINNAISKVEASKNNVIYLGEGVFNKTTDVNIQYSSSKPVCNITIIGAGCDKTFIDGLNKNTFISLAKANVVLTLKNITFTNFYKTSNGAVVTASNGFVNVDNCVFSNYKTGDYNGAIHLTSSSSLNLVNSNFTGTGSAIYASASTISKLYIENNTFSNITKGAHGLAVYTACKNTVIKNNKFINLKATKTSSYDASIYLNNANGNVYVINNQFINCTTPSTSYAVAYVSFCVWANNTFINSSNPNGKQIYFAKPVDGIIYNTSFTNLSVGNNEIKHYFTIGITALDDLNNSGLINTAITANITGANNYTLKTLSTKSVGPYSLEFREIPQNGNDYTLNIKLNDYNAFISLPCVIQVNRNLFEVWVSPTGSDTNAGSRTNPFKTINHALDFALKNSVNVIVNLEEGVYMSEGNVDLDISNLANITIAGVNKNVVIDGNSSKAFLKASTSSTLLSLKNITFKNNRGSSGGVIDVNSGNLNITDCVFTNYVATASNYNSAVSLKGLDSSLSIQNCIFTNSSYGGVYVTTPQLLYLKNNTFINLKKLKGDGLAVYSQANNTVILKNRFINLTSFYPSSKDISLYIDADGGIIKDNVFINCSYDNTNPVAYVGSCTWENNTFINSTNSNGFTVCFKNKVDNLSLYINLTSFKVGNYEVRNGLPVPLKLYDDLNNSVCFDGAYSTVYMTINYTTTKMKLENSKGILKLKFTEIPQAGNYTGNISVNNVDATLTCPVIVDYRSESIDLWVSPSGDNTNNGSISSPFKTIDYARDYGLNMSVNVNIHLLEGRFTGTGNVKLNFDENGNITIIGIIGKSIIDCEKTNNIFINSQKTHVKLINVTFTNSTAMSSVAGSNLEIINCTITNCTTQYQIINSFLNIDGLRFINNVGYINVPSGCKCINNSYFANNNVTRSSYGLIYASYVPLVLENSRFINNKVTVGKGGIVQSTGILTCKNNYFENNTASSGIYSGVLKAEANRIINDTFINNKGTTTGVITFAEPTVRIQLYVIGCKFIRNSATTGPAISNVFVGNFTDCIFEENDGSQNGLFKIPRTTNYNKLSFKNSTFKNNLGCDLYLTSSSSGQYPMLLNIDYTDKVITKMYGTLSVNVYGEGNATVSGTSVSFIFNGENLGSVNVVNGYASIDYYKFDKGIYNLTGSLPYATDICLHNATINVTLSEIIPSVDCWVSTTGSDISGNGSIDNPYKSIEYAIQESSLNCKNIIVHLTEGNYSGDLYTRLTLSCKSNITIIGSGDKTVINGNLNNYFIKVTSGSEKIVISNLTITNITQTAPITVDAGASLYLDNVNFTRNAGIINNGNLSIDSSTFTYNSGIVSGGDVVINNSSIAYSLASINCDNILINNTSIKDIIASTGSVLFDGEKCSIENTNISNNCTTNSLKEWKISNNTNIKPALTIASKIVNLKNVKITNNFNGSLLLAVFENSTSVNVKDSEITNFSYLVVSPNCDVNLTNCILTNISKIAKSSNDTSINISDSILINLNPVIDITDGKANATLNGNYWTSNLKPEIIYNYTSSQVTDSPSAWIIVASQDNKLEIKLTDGENITDYEGSLDFGISYIEYNGQVVPVLNINGDGYLLNISDDNIKMLTGTVIKDITPKPMTNQTVTADNLTTTYGDGNNHFIVNYLQWWSDPISNTNITIVINGTAYWAITDLNGTAKYTFDLKAGKYNVEITNPITHQSITRVLEIDANQTVFADDLCVIKGDGQSFVVNYTDKLANPLANHDVNITIGNTTIYTVTDSKGSAKFVIAQNYGTYTVSIKNPLTAETITKTLTVITNSTIIAEDLTLAYDLNNTFPVTFTDKFTNPLVGQSVSIVIGNRTILGVTNANGSVNFSIDLSYGVYKVIIKNPVSNETVTKTLTILASNTILANDVTVFGNLNIYTVVFTDNINNPLVGQEVSIKIADKTITNITDSTGTARFNVNLSYGRYTVNIKNPVTSQSITKSLTVITNNTILANDTSFKYNLNNEFNAIFTDNFTNRLVNVSVVFKINNNTLTAITDINGSASVKINLTPGEYVISILNPLTLEKVNKTIIINKLSSKITASSLSAVFNVGKNAVITLVDENGKAISDCDVSVKLNGVTHNLKTNANGQAVISTKTLSVNTYALTCEFKGNNIYTYSSTTSKIVIQKASVKLKAKKAKFKAKTKTKKYKVVLKNNVGKALAKIKLTLKVKGKTYKAKTNKKGKATFKIKKLKKKGTFKAKIKFKGNKNYKKLTKTVKISVKK